MLKLGYLYKDLYDMTLFELTDTLEMRKQGLAYEMWRTGNLCQMMEKYPEKPEDVMPELFPPKKTIKMPEWVKEKYFNKERRK